ncbi:sigma-70 family RNA polymerase sigma factor [Hansschlegelia zhihuaiae]|uniref:Sigma-70 family RNA polymerase sigma factor n=1 Tax=Hansschlegelia zhihuaiae TaxID=405005 RepID=A0A4Q0MNG9_9HYPH|nr:sigma-70 family RNA polymerase sigma factor [Hansschlegelia zhihuaiae]RXF75370.1 sigma-70 family RNA polymerase sigma factor [Hansschlegelia zhihuaiae]
MQPTVRRSEDLSRLLGACADGDREAFARLYQASSAKLYGIALRILRRSDLAEEAVQDAYVRIWRRASDFDPARASAVAWMAAIARNRALDIARLKTEAPLDDAPNAGDAILDAPSPEAEAELNDELRRLAACLEELESDRREAVLLAYRSGWSREELAARFGRPVGTLKTWLRRSLMSLRRCLET